MYHGHGATDVLTAPQLHLQITMLAITFTAVLGALLGAAANVPVPSTLNSTGDFPTDYYGVDVSQPVSHRECVTDRRLLMLKVIALL